MLSFVNNNLIQSGSEASITEMSEEHGLYKAVLSLPGSEGPQEVPTYMTKDGNKFFTQALDIAEVEEQNKDNAVKEEAAKTQAAADISKQEKPSVELFVMSHCPYGTQIEKGILPVLEALGDKIDFDLKFCDYAMHSKKELDEQLNQYCIQKNEPDKLISYLWCFLKDSDSKMCLAEAKINTAKLETCVSEIDKEYKVTEGFNDKSTYKGSFPTFNVYKEDVVKYGISGSPALVVNSAKINSGRDAASLLKTICAGFEIPPSECENELSSATPAPGFGLTATGGSDTAGCGS